MPLFPRLGNLRELLPLIGLFGELRDLPEITTPDGLRAGLDLLNRAAPLLGASDALLARIASATDEPHEFDLLLAAIRFAKAKYGTMAEGDTPVFSLAAGETVTVDMPQGEVTYEAAAVMPWLPVVIELAPVVFDLIADFRRRRAARAA